MSMWEFERFPGLWERMETNFEKVLNDMVNEDRFGLLFYSNLIINGEVTCCEYSLDLNRRLQENLTTGTVRKIRLITVSHQFRTNDFEG